MFAVFSKFPKWNWYNLPDSVIRSCYLVLNTNDSISYSTNDCEHGHQESITQDNKSESLSLKYTSARQVKMAQRQLHDILQKCISVLYYNANLNDLQQAAKAAGTVYNNLTKFAEDDNGGIPILCGTKRKAPLKHSALNVHVSLQPYMHSTYICIICNIGS